MKTNIIPFILWICLICTNFACDSKTNEKKGKLTGTSFYINPNSGKDSNTGLSSNKAWQSFAPLNKLSLDKGCRIEILEPGELNESLHLKAIGTKEAPVVINFAPGSYNFFTKNAVKRKFHISNTNDAPDSVKAICIYLDCCKNIRLEGNGAELVIRGKAMEMAIDHSENIEISGFSFDYKRPTVSEIEIIKVDDRYAEARVHPDSNYKVENGQLIWIGEGWQHKAQNYWQRFDSNQETLMRYDLPVQKLCFTELKPNVLRIDFKDNPGFEEGLIFQNRDTFREYCGVFTNCSKNIFWRNIDVWFMHGMGFVSQFTENIFFENLKVQPRPESGRTCAAWADILHFSACKGDLNIKDCILSAANDDAINVHGTHVRITDILSPTQIKVQFVHPQTFGFMPFEVGDDLEFIRSATLLPYGTNKVTAITELCPKTYKLELETSIPEVVKLNDVVENSSWTANLHVSGTEVKHIPTRGFLITTRGKVLIENNHFHKTNMSGILIANDANYWFESGYVRDVTIRNNTFEQCGEPVIKIHPEVLEFDENNQVHKNIRILNNRVTLRNKDLVRAQSTSNLMIENNKIFTIKPLDFIDICSIQSCKEVNLKNNQVVYNQQLAR